MLELLTPPHGPADGRPDIFVADHVAAKLREAGQEVEILDTTPHGPDEGPDLIVF